MRPIALCLVVLAACSGSHSRAHTTTTLPPTKAELSRLLRAGQTARFHVHLMPSGAVPAGGLPGFELWHAGTDRARQDEILGGAGGRHLAQFRLPTGGVSCEQDGNGPWQCVHQDVAPDLDSAAEVAAATEGVTVAARDDTVQGRAARCFSFDGPQGHGLLCLDRAGIPVRLLAGTSTYDADVVDTQFSDDVFAPPAPVS
jgi:hypothetical protein